MNILKRILPKSLKLNIIEHRYILKVMKSKYKKQLKEWINDNRGKSLCIDNEKKWINKLNKLAYSNLENIEFGKAFANSEITILKNIEIKNDDIIAICVEKNDLIRLKKFIEHHRKLGINKFIILDNDSNDGTIEWLLNQSDIAVLQTMQKYGSINRVAWINRIIAYYGDERWYFVADSDELLVYNDCENIKIQDVVSYCNKNKITKARALMVDMYAKPDYYISNNFDKYYDNCIYFDKDSYHLDEREFYINICGGPRERVFDMIPCLTKYPLFYFKNSDIHSRSHFFYPYKENFNSDIILVLKHYKFLPGEKEKYRIIAKEGNYYKSSWAYKEYLKVMEKTNALNFIYENTCEYENSKSLENIKIYKKINWNMEN